MFSKLFGKKSSAKRNADKVWTSREQKHKGLLRLVTTERSGRQIVLLTHFRKSYNEMSGLLHDAGIQARMFQSSIDRLTGRSVFRQPVDGAVALFHINALPEAEEPGADSSHSHVPIRIIVIERYPVPAPDQRIERFADSLHGHVELEFHGALDEPLFRLFGGDRLMGVLSQLGLKEDECIEHTVINSSIRRAQEKLAELVLVESTADSMEEWLERNAPSMRSRE